MVDSIYHTHSLGVAAEGIPDQDANGVSNPGIPNPMIPGSRPVLSIPDPGIAGGLILGFWDWQIFY